jgi:ketosteroid isomerase-like protein
MAEAGNRRDIEAWMSFFAPDAVWDGPWTPGALEGADAIRAMAEEWWGAYEELSGELEQFEDLGGGVGFSVVLETGRPVCSTGVVQVRQGFVALVENGMIARIRTYPDIDEARAAAERLARERA